MRTSAVSSTTFSRAGAGIAPVEADTAGALLDLLGPGEGGEVEWHVIEGARRHGGRRPERALLGLDGFPRDDLGLGVATLGAAEDMGVPGDHLVREAVGDSVEVECALLLGHPGMEHDLEEEVAQLFAKRAKIVARDGVGDLIGFLDRVRRDRREVLLDVPGTAALRIA